ncbi:Protein GET1 [Verticillium dahliae VDG1]|nr:Protein GET1 [Verticillium dahliae VDG1]
MQRTSLRNSGTTIDLISQPGKGVVRGTISIMVALISREPLSFGIIGGGFYGCHIATSLRALGFEVKVFEQHTRLLHEASGNNQFRLHMGFHYARHSDTRIQSRDGFLRFLERYPGLSRSVPCNTYAVASRESLLDYGTYRAVMASSGVEFTEGAPMGVELANVAGVVRTGERVLLLAKARAHFAAELAGVLALGQAVSSIVDTGAGVFIDGERFDYGVDATWGHLARPPGIEVVYEPTLLLYYEGPVDFPAVTLVDGPLCSVYPTEEPGLFTLSSVPHTPLGQFLCPHEARAARDRVAGAPEVIAAKRALMEEQVARYVPSFAKTFRYVGPQLAIKTKPCGAWDDRSCQVVRRGRMLSVLSGKIDTVFFAMERIVALVEEAQAAAGLEDAVSSLRADIALINGRAGVNGADEGGRRERL